MPTHYTIFLILGFLNCTILNLFYCIVTITTSPRPAPPHFPYARCSLQLLFAPPFLQSIVFCPSAPLSLRARPATSPSPHNKKQITAPHARSKKNHKLATSRRTPKLFNIMRYYNQSATQTHTQPKLLAYNGHYIK